MIGIAIRSFEEALSSPNQEVHQWAASFLGDIGPPARHAGPALSKLLASSRYEARYTAAEAIGKIGSGDSITVKNLIELVKRENTNIGDWTPQIVRFTNSGRTGVIPKIVLKSKQKPPSYLVALVSLSKIGAYGALIELLNSENPVRQSAASHALGLTAYSSQQSIDALRKALTSESHEVAARAASALASAGPAAAASIESLIDNVALRNTDEVRVSAILALESIGLMTAQVVDVLEKASNPPNSDGVQTVAKDVLAKSSVARGSGSTQQPCPALNAKVQHQEWRVIKRGTEVNFPDSGRRTVNEDLAALTVNFEVSSNSSQQEEFSVNFSLYR